MIFNFRHENELEQLHANSKTNSCLLTVTGARCVATILHEMKRRGRDCRFGVVSMCIGILLLSLSLSLCVCVCGVLLEHMLMTNYCH
jgi:hypothetical protein